MKICVDCSAEIEPRTVGRTPIRCPEHQAKAAGYASRQAHERYRAKFTEEEWRERSRLKAAQRRRDNPELVRQTKLRWAHGGTEPPGVGPCEICGNETKRVIDHDHDCCPSKDRSCGRCFRGYLCQPCNHMLGHAYDNPTRLRAAAEYLEKHGSLPKN